MSKKFAFSNLLRLGEVLLIYPPIFGSLRTCVLEGPGKPVRPVCAFSLHSTDRSFFPKNYSPLWWNKIGHSGISEIVDFIHLCDVTVNCFLNMPGVNDSCVISLIFWKIDDFIGVDSIQLAAFSTFHEYRDWKLFLWLLTFDDSFHISLGQPSNSQVCHWAHILSLVKLVLNTILSTRAFAPLT